MSQLPEHLGQSIAARKLFRRDHKILVAVSGGVDSMALLHVLHSLAPRHGWRLTVAHFNHQIRGRSSAADESLVRASANKLGVPFVAGRGDVRRRSGAKKISIEMAARELRHGFLARTARQRKIPVIALAHHADDQVELFFLRLFRGGGEGLAGMKWISPSPADAKIKLARPLLDVSKAELETFARENKIRFREDASNATLDFQRNRIRRELLPLLRRDYSPALDKLVLRAMDIVGAESEFVAAAARGDARPTTKKVFTKLAVALQRRVLQGELIARGIAPEFALIERLRSESGAAVSVAPGCAVSRAASGKVRLHKSPAENFSRGRAGLKLGAAGVVSFGGAKISWAIERQRMFRRPTPAVGREFFDADKVGARIVLRHWRPGDRFQPIGMKSAVKLQDLFVNAKIPRERRRELILATTARGEIFWVEGVRMGERFKLTSETGRKLRWEWLRGADSFGCGG